MSEALTTAQAAFVVGEPLDAFKKAVEKAPVKPTVVKRGGQRIRQFGLADLVFLHAYGDLKKELTPKGQAALYKAMASTPRSKLSDRIVFGNHAYDIRPHLRMVESKLKELNKLTSRIEAGGDEAVIKGTRIEAHRIAALLEGGMAVDEVLYDYPSLTEEQVLAAKAYAEANPKRGRPYPKLTAKAALRLADFSGLDDAD